MTSCVHRGYAAVVLLIFAMSLVGCAQTRPATSDAEPVRVQTIAGSTLHRVILTEQAAQSLGIQTQRVGRATRSASASARRSGVATDTAFVPITAVIYDPQGLSWVYTTPAALTFLRAPIVIDHTVAAIAFLKSGPPLGTPVVTVGASELLGAEYGVGGE